MAAHVLPQDLQGTIVKRRAVPGFRLTENLYGQGLRTARHFHDHGLLGCVLAGGYANSYRRAVHDVRGQVVMFCPAGEVHETSSPAGARCFNLEVEPAWMKRVQETSPDEGPALFTGSTMEWLAIRLYREFHEPDDAAALAIEGLALEMMALLIRQRQRPTSRRPPGWLEDVRERLRETFGESVSVTTLARLAEVHPVYLATAFRQHYGQTIGEYVRERRILYASRRLATSTESLAAIAQAAGFADQSHFSRTFKRLTGMTPGGYRATFGPPGS